jgi:phosphoserine phosphatase
MAGEGLASWKEGAAKRAITSFVERVTREGNDFVAPQDRVAVFDNDGTLWCEKPLPIQADFLLRRLAKMASKDPALRNRQPWKAAVERDYAWLAGVITKHYGGDDSDLKVMGAGLLQAYAGSSIEEFESEAGAFVRSAENPRLERPYLRCAYQPMIELVRYLEANGFTNFIASGGGRDFMRSITQDLYGVSPDRVIGSALALEYHDGGPIGTLTLKPDVDILDDGPSKPVRIWSRIGRRPILAAGNSNGDVPMLHYCRHPSRPSLALLIDHDDEDREFAYREGAEQAQDRARAEGWCVISVKNDWKAVFVQ